MKICLFAPILACLLVIGCEQKPAEPSGARPPNSPAPTPSATPSLGQTTTPTPSTTPAVAPSTPPTPEPPPSVSPAPTTASPTASPSAATSDGRPTFSSQSANEYVQSYDRYINDFKMAYQAMKRGDMTKYQTVIQRAQELESKGEKLGGELTPEEEKRFADYLSRKADEIAQFASQNR